MSGTLYVVATPIGNLEDFTARGRVILDAVDVIACEDTRKSAHLFRHFNIKTRAIAYHEHNAKESTAQLIDTLKRGKDVALISDAGTPLVSDPGYLLVSACHKAGIKVSPILGACAAIGALCVSGLPTHSFTFIGFLPAKKTARLSTLETLIAKRETLILYEAPHRIKETLADILRTLGDRRACFCRELTKTFETIKTGNVSHLLDFIDAPHQQKGEMVLILEGQTTPPKENEDYLPLLRALLDVLPPKKAVSVIAKLTGLPKSALYQEALSLKES